MTKSWIRNWKRKLGRKAGIRDLALSKTVLHVTGEPTPVADSPNRVQLKCCDDNGTAYELNLHYMTLNKLLDILLKNPEARFFFEVVDQKEHAPLVFVKEAEEK